MNEKRKVLLCLKMISRGAKYYAEKASDEYDLRWEALDCGAGWHETEYYHHDFYARTYTGAKKSLYLLKAVSLMYFEDAGIVKSTGYDTQDWRTRTGYLKKYEAEGYCFHSLAFEKSIPANETFSEYVGYPSETTDTRLNSPLAYKAAARYLYNLLPLKWRELFDDVRKFEEIEFWDLRKDDISFMQSFLVKYEIKGEVEARRLPNGHIRYYLDMYYRDIRMSHTSIVLEKDKPFPFITNENSILIYESQD